MSAVIHPGARRPAISWITFDGASMPFSLFRGIKSPPKVNIKPSLNSTSAVYADSWGKKIGISAVQAGVGVGASVLAATYASGIGVDKLSKALGFTQPTNAEKLDAETKAMKGNFDELMRERDILNSQARDPNYYAFRNVLNPFTTASGNPDIKDNSGKTNAMPFTNAAVILGVLALAGIALVMFKRGKK